MSEDIKIYRLTHLSMTPKNNAVTFVVAEANLAQDRLLLLLGGKRGHL